MSDRGVLVTGYLSERIQEHIAQHKPPFEVSLAPNPDYATTNNVVSLLAARSHLGPGSLVICDGDVVLSGDAIRRLMDEADPCALLVDQEARLADEEMKVILDSRGKVTRLSKTIDPKVAAGESIGIQKIGGPALGRLWPTLDELGSAIEDSLDALAEDPPRAAQPLGLRLGAVAAAAIVGAWLAVGHGALLP